jgi:hypothetical protein
MFSFWLADCGDDVQDDKSGADEQQPDKESG